MSWWIGLSRDEMAAAVAVHKFAHGRLVEFIATTDLGLYGGRMDIAGGRKFSTDDRDRFTMANEKRRHLRDAGFEMAIFGSGVTLVRGSLEDEARAAQLVPIDRLDDEPAKQADASFDDEPEPPDGHMPTLDELAGTPYEPPSDDFDEAAARHRDDGDGGRMTTGGEGLASWRIWLPAHLLRLLRDFKADPSSATNVLKMTGTVRGLADVATWQRARIEQLEAALADAGATCPARCFACQSREVDIEPRDGQHRHRCRACGYVWRLGLRDRPEDAEK